MIKEELLKDYPYAELGSADRSARIKIYVYNYEFPDSKDSCDADWYMNYISVRLDGVTAKINEPVIEGRVLESLLTEAKAFVRMKTKELHFRFTEPVFIFSLHNKSCQKSGLHVTGSVITKNTRLGFKFQTDMESVKHFIEGMECIIKEFPPRYT